MVRLHATKVNVEMEKRENELLKEKCAQLREVRQEPAMRHGCKKIYAVVQSPKFSPKISPKESISFKVNIIFSFNNSAENVGPFPVNAHWHSNNSFLSLLVVNHVSSAFLVSSLLH